jgi:hypothetical protein
MIKIGKTLFTLFLLVFSFTIFNFVNVHAQTSQDTLNQYISDLQKNPDNFALKEKIIRHVQTMKKVPAVPEEARRHHVMAVTLLKDAKDAGDYAFAVEEFKAAMLAAPWWPTAYSDLSVALKGAELYNEAINALKLYLLSGPSEKDARQAQDQIYVLEAKKKKQTESHTAALQKEAEAREKARTPSLAGYWRDSISSRYLLKVEGDSFTMTRVMACWVPPSQDWDTCPDLRPDNTLTLLGTINNSRLSGFGVNFTDFRSRQQIMPDGSRIACPVYAGNFPITFSELSADGTVIRIKWTASSENSNCAPLQFGGDYRREQ